jgi:hypothetical protein
MCTACAELVCYEHRFNKLVSNVLLGKIWFKKYTESSTGVLAVNTCKILPQVYEFSKTIRDKIFLKKIHILYTKSVKFSYSHVISLKKSLVV